MLALLLLLKVLSRHPKIILNSARIAVTIGRETRIYGSHQDCLPLTKLKQTAGVFNGWAK